MQMGEILSQLGSTVAAIMFFWMMYQSYLPDQLRALIERYPRKLANYFCPYRHITFNEFDGDSWFQQSKAFAAIERYLGANSYLQAKRLRAKVVGETEAVVLTMDDHEQVTDRYKGTKLWWSSSRSTPTTQSFSFHPREDEKRSFKLTFHRMDIDLVIKSYIKHVLQEGKAISVRDRQRKLYSNNGYGYCRGLWGHVKFGHPANFDTLALDTKLKQEIIDDLVTFSKSKEYYAKIGKAWKRGYLLYGPPGTGKSTMIAAMANFLKYDVYDVELTAVKDNTVLRKLLVDTSSKSIIVFEDIDCSLDLTGQRKKQEKKDEKKDEKKKENKNPVEKQIEKEEENKKKSEVTLSGLLNCIDGLWSTCAEERIFVFTTNFVEKLDPALIRRGRMDKHIEMSYCRFEAFKVLAKNYLNQHSDHEMYPTISRLLEEVNMTPADVAENLMPKSADDNAATCFNKLIEALEEAKKEEKKRKAEEEERLKAKKAEEEQKRKENAEEEDKRKDEASNKDLKENGPPIKT